MSNLSDFLGAFSGGAKFRYQEFFSSGTFNPSAKLLENGGQVMLDLRGGGGGGAAEVGGGSSKHIAPYTVTGATSVVIGLGGAYGYTTGATGGTSSFGTLSVPGGAGGNYNSYASCNLGGKGSGNEGRAAPSHFFAATSGGGVGASVTHQQDTSTDNSGCGGPPYGAGKAGYCRVTWWE